MNHTWATYNRLWERCTRDGCGESRLLDESRRELSPYDPVCSGRTRQVTLRIEMRTVTHFATESDRMDPISGAFITCDCGKKAVTRDEIAKMHQRSRRVIPGVTVLDKG